MWNLLKVYLNVPYCCIGQYNNYVIHTRGKYFKSNRLLSEPYLSILILIHLSECALYEKLFCRLKHKSNELSVIF